ncbi:MAG: tRNA 2-thiocytidine(32) synthetase TtcA [Cyclobacteriaceae bacterium]|nr:tRNA 2-thiocytidine(32) synthetase TtcA [Cyclobacteriaceae bacterium]
MNIQELEKSYMAFVRALRRKVWQVQEEFELVEAGDKVLVCLSGGKDSYTMLDMLMNMRRAMNDSFEIEVFHLDQKQPGYPAHILPNYLKEYGQPFKIMERNTYRVVMDKLKPEQTMCSLCSRLRRGTIYEYARQTGANKIALGHHREDVLETFFLNIFFGGKLEAMPARFLNDEEDLTVIRPLVYCPEEMIVKYAALREFPIIPCNLCGSQPNLQRSIIKEMMKNWEVDYPDRKEIILTSLKNIHASHLLDTSLYDFKNCSIAMDNSDS